MNGIGVAEPQATGGLPDHALVAAVRRGDDRAFEQLYARYHPRIAAYVRGMVKDHGRAEDVTQEVFFSALRRMRETERTIAFKPWVYEIARNACIDLFRRTSRAEEVSYDSDGGMPGDDYRHLVSRGPEPDAAVDAKQQLDHLRGAFGGLSETHHQILVLRELEGLSYREIGERLGMSRPAVESTLFRARRRLTEEYDELVSGRRCQRVQGIIATAAEGMLGARDERRLARHLSYCQACRREARLMGVETAGRPRTTVAAKVAALLPLPAFLRRGRGGDDAGAASATGHPGFAVQLTSMLPVAEPAAAGWAKAAAAIVTLAVAGVGAGVATHQVTGLAIPGLDRIPLIKDVAGGSDSQSRPKPATGIAGPGARDGGGARGTTAGGGGTGGGSSSARLGGGTHAAGEGDASSVGSLGTLPGSTGAVPGGPSAPDVRVPDVGAPSQPSGPGTPSTPDAGHVSQPDQPSPPKVNSSAPDVSVPSPPPVSAPSVPDTSSAGGTVKGAGVGN
jgi:RNA polymerase sigma factor (sigma-70 family)